jgi:hypothetical protein
MNVRRLLTFALLVVFLMMAVQARAQRPPRAPERIQPKEKSNAKRNVPTPEEESLKAFQRDQAVQLLRDALISSSSIQDVGERSLLVSRAVELIWRYDEQTVQLSISKTFDNLLVQSREPEVLKSAEKRRRLNTALNRLVATVLRKDAKLGASAQRQLAEMRKDTNQKTSPEAEQREVVTRPGHSRIEHARIDRACWSHFAD